MGQLLRELDWSGPEVQALREHAERLLDVHLRELVGEGPQGSDVIPGLHVDVSKQHLDAAAWADLLKLAQAAGLESSIASLFAGNPINETEGRAVMHMALRAEAEDALAVDGRDVMPDVLEVRDRFLGFADSVRSAGTFKHVVNIGIGGSDLGPLMVTRALRGFATEGPQVHFVSNVDPAHLSATLADLNPAETLFIIVSKTFTTQETMANAAMAKAWLTSQLGDHASIIANHFAAVSSAVDKAEAFGISAERVFGFANWVGGRYSLWGPVGLAIACAVGSDAFRELQAGARDLDQHFKHAPLHENLPVMLGLLGIWNRNFLKRTTHAVLPYAQDLDRFPAYLQQADMESNGKRMSRSGQLLAHETGPVVWGEAGTNGQHAFYQLLHQGSDIHPVDFIAFKKPMSDLPGAAKSHQMLLANAIAQAEAMMVGRSKAETPHKLFPGNRPSTFMFFDELTPRSVGQLIALHEHRIFVQGVLWNLFSFDQWGVELGKVLANQILDEWHRNIEGEHDNSTQALMRRAKA